MNKLKTAVAAAALLAGFSTAASAQCWWNGGGCFMGQSKDGCSDN
jgi:hypothetical protein